MSVPLPPQPPSTSGATDASVSTSSIATSTTAAQGIIDPHSTDDAHPVIEVPPRVYALFCELNEQPDLVRSKDLNDEHVAELHALAGEMDMDVGRYIKYVRSQYGHLFVLEAQRIEKQTMSDLPMPKVGPATNVTYPYKNPNDCDNEDLMRQSFRDGWKIPIPGESRQRSVFDVDDDSEHDSLYGEDDDADSNHAEEERDWEDAQAEQALLIATQMMPDVVKPATAATPTVTSIVAPAIAAATSASAASASSSSEPEDQNPQVVFEFRKSRLSFTQPPLWYAIGSPSLPPNPYNQETQPDEHQIWEEYYTDDYETHCFPLMNEAKSIEAANKHWDTLLRNHRDHTKHVALSQYIIFLMTQVYTRHFKEKAPISFLSFCSYGLREVTRFLLNSNAFTLLAQASVEERRHFLAISRQLMIFLHLVQTYALDTLEFVPTNDAHMHGLFDALEMTLTNATNSLPLRHLHRHMKQLTIDQIRANLQIPSMLRYLFADPLHTVHLNSAITEIAEYRRFVRDATARLQPTRKQEAAKLQQQASGVKVTAAMRAAAARQQQQQQRHQRGGTAEDSIVVDDSGDEGKLTPKNSNVIKLPRHTVNSPQPLDSQVTLPLEETTVQTNENVPSESASPSDDMDDEVQEISSGVAVRKSSGASVRHTAAPPMTARDRHADDDIDEPDDENSSVGGRAADSPDPIDAPSKSISNYNLTPAKNKATHPLAAAAPSIGAAVTESKRDDPQDGDSDSDSSDSNDDDQTINHLLDACLTGCDPEHRPHFEMLSYGIQSPLSDRIFGELTRHFLAQHGWDRLLRLIHKDRNALKLEADSTAATSAAASAAASSSSIGIVSPSPSPLSSPVAASSSKSGGGGGGGVSASADYPPITHTAFGAATPFAPSLPLIRRVSFIYALTRNHVPRALIAQYVRALFTTVGPSVQYLTEQQLRAEPPHLLSVGIHSLIVLIEQVFWYLPTPDLDEAGLPCHIEKRELECFEIEFAFRLLRSQTMERRLLGLKCLNRFVEPSVMTKFNPNHTLTLARCIEMTQAILQQRLDARPPPICIFGATACRTLVQYGLIDILFGEQLHIQLLKRSYELLKAIASYVGMLQAVHIEAMWQASRGKHETVIQAIYATFIEIAPVMKANPAVYLYRRIYSVPVHEYDARLIDMINETSRHLLGNWVASYLWEHTHSWCTWDKMLTLWQRDQEVRKQRHALADPIHSQLKSLPPLGVRPDIRNGKVDFNPALYQHELTHTSCAPCQLWDDFPPGIENPFNELPTPQMLASVCASRVEYFGVDLLWRAFNTVPPNERKQSAVASSSSSVSPSPSSSSSLSSPSLTAILRDQCFTSLTFNLLSPIFEEPRPGCGRRVEFLMLAYKNIRQHQNVSHSLTLMLRCIESFTKPSPYNLIKPTSSIIGRDRDDRPKVILWLETNKSLSTVLFDDLTHFGEQLQRRLTLQSTRSPLLEDDTYSLTFWKGCNYQLQQRLEFIKFVYQQMENAADVIRESQIPPHPSADPDAVPPVPLSIPKETKFLKSHIEGIFNSFLLPAIMTNELRETVFRWLSQCFTDELLMHLVEWIFHELIARLDWAKLSPAGLHFMFQCFRHVNGTSGAMTLKKFNHMMAASANHEFIVHSYPIAGTDYLWSAAFFAHDKGVQSNSVMQLFRIYNHIDPSLQSDINQRYEECIARCMQHIHDCTIAIRALNHADDTEMSSVPSLYASKTANELVSDLHRGFTILTMMITKFEGTKPTSHESAMKQAAISTQKRNVNVSTANSPAPSPRRTPGGPLLMVRFRGQPFEEITIKPELQSTIRELYGQLLKTLSVNSTVASKLKIEDLIILANGGVIKPSEDTLASLNLQNDHCFMYSIPRISTILDSEDIRAINTKLANYKGIWDLKRSRPGNVTPIHTPIDAGLAQLADLSTTTVVTIPSTSTALIPISTPSPPVATVAPAVPSAHPAPSAPSLSPPALPLPKEEKEREQKQDTPMQVDTVIPSAPSAPASPPAPTISHPTEILSRSEYFNQLFDLLSLSIPGSSRATSSVADACWKLLMQLPTNAQMLQRLKQLSSSPLTPNSKRDGMNQRTPIQWSILIPTDLHKLHYSLQIIFAIIPHHRPTRVNQHTIMDAPPADSPTTPVTPATPSTPAKSSWDPDVWERNFVARGGLRHLVKILVETDFSTPQLNHANTLASPMPSSTPMMNGSAATNAATAPSRNQQTLECLALLLKIVLRFTHQSVHATAIMSSLDAPPALTAAGSVTSSPIIKPTPVRAPSLTNPAPLLLASNQPTLTTTPPSAGQAMDTSSTEESKEKESGSWLKKRKADDSISTDALDTSDFLASARQVKKRAIESIASEEVASELKSVFSYDVVEKLFSLWQNISAQPDHDNAAAAAHSSTSSSIPSLHSTMAATAATVAEAELATIGPKTFAAASALVPTAPAMSYASPSSSCSILNDIVSDSLQVLSNILIRRESSEIVKRFFFDQQSIVPRWLHTLLASPRRESMQKGQTHLLAISHYWSVTLTDSPVPNLARHLFHATMYFLLSNDYDTLFREHCLQARCFMQMPVALLKDLQEEFIQSAQRYNSMGGDACQQAIENWSTDAIRNNPDSSRLHIDALQLVDRTFERLRDYRICERFGDSTFDETWIGYANLIEATVAMLLPKPVVVVPQAPPTDATMTDANAITTSPIPPPLALPPYSPLSRLIRRDDMLGFIFRDCLFDVPAIRTPLDVPRASNAPLCKHKDTRQCAFALLRQLSLTDSLNFTSLQRLMFEQQLDRREDDLGWNYLPDSERKRFGNYCGLVNQGATCYMNSLMQQLFMVPEFRYGILAQMSTDGLSEKARRDSLMFQMQSIFGNLMDSDKGSYDAHCFCAAYKDYDGQPMQKGVQMDVNEFFNVLFDKLEQSLKGSPHASLLDHCFGGKLTNQLIGREASCSHTRERLENFYILSLDVKGKKNVAESMKAFVEGEMLEGDNKFLCSECNRKVDTLKRVCIANTPNNLILHLKRFEFDLDSMNKIKVNDAFEFPPILDIYDFTNEGLAAAAAAKDEAASSATKTHVGSSAGGAGGSSAAGSAETPSAASAATAAALSSASISPSTSALDSAARRQYQYELTGVIIHSGTAAGGHYYSYALERAPQPHCNHATAIPQWYNFNDSRVDTFNFDTLAENAFGGADGHYLKPYSAYMLFYQRVDMAHKPHQLGPSEIPRSLPNNQILQGMKDEVLANTPAHLPTAQETFNSLAHPIGLTVGSLAEAKHDGDDTEMVDVTTPGAAAASAVKTKASHKRKSINDEDDDDDEDEQKSVASEGSTSPEEKHSLQLASAYRTRVATNDVVGLRRCLTREEQSALLPPQLFDDIWFENVNLTKDSYLFDASNLTFIWQHGVLAAWDFTPILTDSRWSDEDDAARIHMHALQLASSFLSRTLVHAKQKSRLTQWETDLKRMVATNVPAARYFLDLLAHDLDLCTIHLLHTQTALRKAWNACIYAAIECVRPFEKSSYQQLKMRQKVWSSDAQQRKRRRTGDVGDHVDEEGKNGFDEWEYDTDENGVAPYESTIARFVNAYVCVDPLTLNSSWSRSSHWWQLLLDIAQLGPEESQLLNSLPRGTLIACVQGLIGADCPIHDDRIQALISLRYKKKIPGKQIILLIEHLLTAHDDGTDRSFETGLALEEDTYHVLTHATFTDYLQGEKDEPDLVKAIENILNIVNRAPGDSDQALEEEATEEEVKKK